MRHLILCLFSVGSLRAQSLPDPVLSAVAGGGGYRQVQDAFGIFCNPASVAQTRVFTAGFYSERKFMLEGLQQFCGVAAFPLAASGVGLQVEYAGSVWMNETALGMAYGRRLGDRMAAGLRFRYYGLRVPGHVRASALWAEAGVNYRLSDRLRAGFSWSHAIKNRLYNDEPDLTRTFRMGLGYEPAARLFIMTEWVRQSRQDLQGSFGLHYAFEEGFRIRMGWNTHIAQPMIGAGLYWQKTWFDILIAYHPYLGFTPGLQCVFSPNEKKESTP